jgi:hypothetical protein
VTTLTPLSAIRHALLRCDPLSGTHPKGEEACEELTTAGGDPANLVPNEDQACTADYDPVTVLAVGNWDGLSHRFERVFANPCAMAAATGSVFAF